MVVIQSYKLIFCPIFVQFLFKFHYLFIFFKSLRCFHLYYFDPRKHIHMHSVRWQIMWMHRVQHAFFTIAAIFRHFFCMWVCECMYTMVSCQATCLFCARCYFFLIISFCLHMCLSVFVSFRSVWNVTLNHIWANDYVFVCLYEWNCIWFDLSSIG